MSEGSGSEVGTAVKGQHEGSLWGWMCSISWLYQRQYPGCNIVLQLCKILQLGKLGERHMESLCYFFKLHVYLQSYKKNFNKRSKYYLFITVLFIMAKIKKQSKCPKLRDVKVN